MADRKAALQTLRLPAAHAAAYQLDRRIHRDHGSLCCAADRNRTAFQSHPALAVRAAAGAAHLADHQAGHRGEAAAGAGRVPGALPDRAADLGPAHPAGREGPNGPVRSRLARSPGVRAGRRGDGRRSDGIRHGTDRRVRRGQGGRGQARSGEATGACGRTERAGSRPRPGPRAVGELAAAPGQRAGVDAGLDDAPEGARARPRRRRPGNSRAARVPPGAPRLGPPANPAAAAGDTGGDRGHAGAGAGGRARRPAA